MESSRGALESWSWNDVQAWLSEQPALAKYAKELEVRGCAALDISGLAVSRTPCKLLGLPVQGTTGKELVCFSNELLVDVGICNPLHRMQLLNRRDEVLQKENSSGFIPALGSINRAPSAAANPLYARQPSGLQVRPAHRCQADAQQPLL